MGITVVGATIWLSVLLIKKNPGTYRGYFPLSLENFNITGGNKEKILED